MANVTKHEWNGHTVEIRKLKVKESRGLFKLLNSAGDDAFESACEALDIVCASVDGEDWDVAVDTEDLADFTEAAIGFFRGEDIIEGIEHLAGGLMPGDVIPYEAEVLYLAKQTGWLPQDIEEMDYIYYSNISAAWNRINELEKRKGGGR